jgi:hypothetical protein
MESPGCGHDSVTQSCEKVMTLQILRKMRNLLKNWKTMVLVNTQSCTNVVPLGQLIARPCIHCRCNERTQLRFLVDITVNFPSWHSNFISCRSTAQYCYLSPLWNYMVKGRLCTMYGEGNESRWTRPISNKNATLLFASREWGISRQHNSVYSVMPNFSRGF